MMTEGKAPPKAGTQAGYARKEGMAENASTTRVKRFRSKMSERGYARIEFSIDCASIDTIRRLAHERKMPIWQAVEQAIELLAKASGSAAG